MIARMRFSPWTYLAGCVLIVVLVGLALLHASDGAWSAFPGTARAASEALTPAQIAAVEGGYLLLSSDPRPPSVFLPLVHGLP